MKRTNWIRAIALVVGLLVSAGICARTVGVRNRGDIDLWWLAVIEPHAAVVTDIGSGFPAVGGLTQSRALDPWSRRLYIQQVDGQLLAISIDSGNLEATIPVSGGRLTHFRFNDADRELVGIYTADADSLPRLARLNPATGVLSTHGAVLGIAPGLTDDAALDVIRRRLFVQRTDGRILEIDTVSGAQVRHFDVAPGAFDRFSVERQSGKLIGLREQAGTGWVTVVSLDPPTGAMQDVQAMSGFGGALGPSVALNPYGQEVWAHSMADGAIWVLNYWGAGNWVTAGVAPGTFTRFEYQFLAPRFYTAPSVTADVGGALISISTPSEENTPMASYRADCTSADGGVARSVEGASIPLQVTGLTNERHYTCTVTATNAVGLTAVSLPSPEFMPTALGIHGRCGSANGVPTVYFDDAHACAVGTVANIDNGENRYAWQCIGSLGGTSDSCSAPRLPMPVRLIVTPGLAWESTGSVRIRVQRVGDASRQITFDYRTIDKTALAGQDYVHTQGSAVIVAGAAYVDIEVHLLNDAEREDDETFDIEFSNYPADVVVEPPWWGAEIKDDDPSSLILDSIARATEGEAIVFTVIRQGDITIPVSVPWWVEPGSATGDDYVEKSGVLAFPAGVTTRTISIRTVDDRIAESEVPDSANPFERFRLVLGVPSHPGTTVGNAYGYGVIVDNDTSIVEFAAREVQVTEGGTATLTVRRTGMTTTAVSVPWTTSGYESTSNRFSPISGTLSFPAGATSATLSIVTVDDTIPESRISPAVIGIALGTPSQPSTSIGVAATASINVLDNDISVLKWQTVPITVLEGGTARMVVLREGDRSRALSIPWDVSYYPDQPQMLASQHGTLSFAAGASSATIAIPTINNQGPNGIGPAFVTLTMPAGAGVEFLGNEAAQVIVLDDDISIGFGDGVSAVSESAGEIRIPVTKEFGGGAVRVTWSASEIDAKPGVDFGTRGNSTANGVIDFRQGDLFADLVIPILDNTQSTGSRQFKVTLDAATNARIRTDRSTFVVTIVEDDKGVQFSKSATTVAERSGSVSLQVDRLGPTNNVLSVNWATANGTAIAGTHFGTAGSPAQPSGTLTWPVDDATPHTIVVPIHDDAVTNANRTFTVTLTSPVGASLAANKTATVTIGDDDNTVQFTAATRTISESAGNLTLTVTRVGGAAEPASVTWRTTNGTAMAGTDFGVVGDVTTQSGVLAWGANDKTNKSITIPIINNTGLSGANRTFSVSLESPTGATLGGVNAAGVTISDDEKGVAFAAASYEVGESASSVSVSVLRVGDSSMALSVPWSTANGTAAAGTHFGTRNSTTQRAGTLSWAAGETAAKTVAVPIISNTLADGDHRFSIILGAMPAGFTKGLSDVAEVIIRDDDLPTESMLSFAASKVVTLEGAGARADLVVRRGVYPGCVGPDCNLVRPVSVRYGTVPGTALAGSDFVAVSNALLEFASGETTKSISIALANDAVAEALETFSVKLSSPSPSLVLGEIPEVIVVVRDDDEQFPPAGNWPAGWTVPQLPGVTREIGWHVVTESGAAEGFAALRTDSVMDDEIAAIDTPFDQRKAGEVRFKYRVSSEAGFDWLRLYQCDVQAVCAKLGEWSGTANESSWTQAAIAVPQGAYRFRWAFEKDDSVSVGRDAAWLDQVQLPPPLP